MPDNINLLMSSAGIPAEPANASEDLFTKQLQESFNPTPTDPKKGYTPADAANETLTQFLRKDLGNFATSPVITPYTYDAGINSSSFYDRYKAYGNETFDRIGFSPFKNNDAEFNAGTSAMSEYKRSMTYAMGPLFARGFTSGVKSLGRAIQGDFGDDPEEATGYARAAAIGNSTKGGFVGFTNNLGVSFAYTAGIISEAIAEEIVGMGITALTGAPTGAVTTYRLLNAGRRVSEGLEGVKAISNISEASFKTGKYLQELNALHKTRELLAASKAAEKSANRGKKFVNFINPLSNTTEAISDIIRNKGQLNNIARASSGAFKTAGALYSDVRNINMALSEARLEGGFIRNDFFNERVEEYKKTHNGERPDDATLDRIKNEAGQASADGMFANTLIIYASNKVAFNNIMNPKRGLNALLNKSLSTIKKNVAGKTVREFTTKTLKSGAKVLTPKLSWIDNGWKGFKGTAQSIRKQGFQKVALKTIGYTKANLMEGVQESVQDIISNTSKDYHKQAFYSEPVSANLFTEAQLKVLRDKRSGGKMFTDALGKQFSWEGGETFLSGFAMGTMAHPLNQALPFLQKTKQKIFNKEQYKADKEYLKNYGANMAKSVNDTFQNDPLNYFNTRLFGLGEQTELNKVIQSGTTKEELDARNEATIKQVTGLIEMNQVDTYVDYLESLKQLTSEEYAEMMNSTEEETKGHVEKLDLIINRTKEIEKQYKEINETMPSPVNLQDYEKGTLAYEKAAIGHAAWEEGKKAIIFYNETFKNTVMRMQSVFQDLASNKLIGKIDPNKVQVLLKESRLDSEINIIENELTSLKGLDDDYSKKQVKEKTELLTGLKEFKVELSGFMDRFYNNEQKGNTKEKEYVEDEIDANAPLKGDKRSQRKLKEIKLKSFEKRSANLTEAEENDAANLEYKQKEEAFSTELAKLKARREQLQSPEYYETYMKDTQFTEKEIQSIDRKINKIEKEQRILAAENNDRSEVKDQMIMNRLEASFKKYMKILAKQSDDIILDGNIDQAFEKLVDYYRLGEESYKLSDAVNMLTDPSGFMDHVERTYDWMSDSWNNREESIKKNINDQLERLKYNQLLNEMASRGIYVDLDEFADFKEFGTLPTEFFDATNKRVIKAGSPIYEQLLTEFSKLHYILEFVESQKSGSDKLNDTIARLNAEEQDELNKLPREEKRVKVRDIVSPKPFSIQVIADQVGVSQYVEAKYNDGTVKTQIYFKDKDGVLRFDNATGEPVDLKAKGEEGKIKFDSAEIFSLVETPNVEEAKLVKDKYDEERAKAAEESVEETSKPFVPTEAVPVVEITADTLVEDMPTDLRVQLIDAYDAYRADPKNKSLFPDTLTEEDLRNKFQTYIKSEPEALEIIETYLKEQKLKVATQPSGDVVVPMITLPNGKTVSADEVDDATLQAALKRYRLLISEMNNKDASKLSPQEREDFARLKIKANILSAYIENERVKEMSPELQKAQVIIDQLQKEQEKITPMPTGYDVEGDILRRVSNVIAGLKGQVYTYGAMDGSMDEIRALYNQTIGAGLSVDAFVEKIIEAKLPGFNMWSTKGEDTYNFDKFKADIETAIADQSTQPTTDTKADIERRKQALRDLMKATGDDIFMLGVEDGTFMGESLLNMNENGDVVLTRYADSEEGLTKGKGKTKNLKDIAGQFGGEQIATSGIEGGAASFANGVVGEYHIPLQELIDLIKSEDVVFAGLGNKEFVLSPHIADKYLTKINGKQINTKYNAELAALEETETTVNAEYYESPYGTIAANYLFTGGKGVILSTDYLLQALTAVFPYSGKAIDNIRNKYANELSQILKDDINTDIYNSVMQEIRDAINNIYGNEKANKIFEKILKNATGFTLSREGNQVSSDAEKLNEEQAALEGTEATETTKVAVTYASLLDNARTQESQGQNKPLSFLFFGNLENALRSNTIKSKAELNDIIKSWDEQAAYNGNPNRMTDLQASKLAKLSESLPETTPVSSTTTTTEVSKPSVLEAVEALVTEKTYEENRVGGNYIDAQGKLFFNGEEPVFDPKKITKEAFDALYGDNGLFQIVQQWIDTNDLIIVSKGLVVYDKQAKVAGEIDLLLVNKKGEFFIVDLKTGSKAKWEDYNTPGKADYQKKIENTYQQGAYVNLLYNMFGIKAIPKIFPIEVFLDSTTGKVIKASKPTSSTALKPGKILIDLDITKEMQDKLDEIIPPTTPSVSAVPLSASVEKIVGEKVPEPIEKSVGEEDAKLSDTVLKLKAEIDKADFDKLQMIELNFGMKSLTMTAEEVFQVQEMLDSRRALLTSGETVVMQEKSYTTGDEVFAESVIFAEKGKNKGEIFLQPFEVATIVKINFTANTVTIRPVGRTNEMTVPMETLDKTFKLKSEIPTEKVEETKTTTEDKILVEESNDIVSILTDDKIIQSKLEKEADAIGSVDDTLNELLDDLDC